MSINPINKDSVVYNAKDKLKYFYEPKPNSIETAKAPWQRQEVQYTINNDALNERFDYSVSKLPKIYRIITLGDSFTFGLFVNTGENYPETLENLLNENLKCKNIDRFEVINLGVPGYDLQYEEERFKLRGNKYAPDLVLWLLTDKNRLLEISKPMIDDCIKKNPSSINTPPYNSCWIIARNDVIKRFGIEKIDNIQKTIFEDFFTYYKQKAVFLDIFHEHERILDSFKHMSNVYIVNNFSNFFTDWRTNQFPDGHPNENGYKIITNDFFKYLTNNKIIPCN